MQKFFTKIQHWDMRCLRALQAVHLPKPIFRLLQFIVRTGDGWIWLLIAFLLWMNKSWPDFKTILIQCLVALAVSLILYWPIKLGFKRKRPHHLNLGIEAKVPPLDKYSFPSGHTMNNLAVALSLATFIPELFYYSLFIPLGLGLLRVFFGVHFLSDIAAGALLGILSFVIAKLLPLHFM